MKWARAFGLAFVGSALLWAGHLYFGAYVAKTEACIVLTFIFAFSAAACFCAAHGEDD